MGNRSYERYSKIRDLKNLTDYKITKLADLNGTASISNWKNGKYQLKDDKMKAIAEVLEVTPEYLKGETDLVVCTICGFGNNPLSEKSREEHAKAHKKFLNIKNIYPFFMNYQESVLEINRCIADFNSTNKSIEESTELYDRYLKASYSKAVCTNNYEISNRSFEYFCKLEVSSLDSGEEFSDELLSQLYIKYDVDKTFTLESEIILRKASGNDSLMRLLKYAERLSKYQLETITVQVQALADLKDKE